MAHLSHCNLVSFEGAQRRFWRFGTRGTRAHLQSRPDGQPGTSLPARWVQKGWGHLWKRRCNIVWLPAGSLFFRVLQLPPCEPDELPAMIEFQLDKLSPVPLGQLAWSFEPVPDQTASASGDQTVLLILAHRSVIEPFLNDLEAEGFLTDRVEVSFLHQLLTTPVDADGVWLYPLEEEGRRRCLAAWWYGGTLRTVNLHHLSSEENWATDLEREIRESSWAGELDGWLTGTPRWHLVADPDTSREWEPVIRALAGTEVHCINPPSVGELAELGVARIAHGTCRANLLPGELVLRYRQRFIDRLWMRALGGIMALYILGVLGYFGWLQYMLHERSLLEARILSLEPEHEQARELQARGEVLEQQIKLRSAALDGWRAAAEFLPAGLTLSNFAFERGDRLTLSGQAPTGSTDRIMDFSEALRRWLVAEEPFFAEVGNPTIQQRGGSLEWSFQCDLQTR